MKRLSAPLALFFILPALLSLVSVSVTGCGDTPVNDSVIANNDTVPPLTGKFFTLSDVHFDPFLDTTLVDQLRHADVSQWETILNSSTVPGYSAYGKDADYRLMNSAFTEMRNVMANPDFIIITGDFLGHNFQADFSQYAHVPKGSPEFSAAVDSFITKTIQFMALQLHAQFPATPLYPVLGNNDDFCGDYMIEPNDPFLTTFANAWAPYFDSTNRASLMETFPANGYYKASLPGYPDHVILGLNTMFFSKKNKSTCMPLDTSSGTDELKWLSQALALCQQQNQKVWFTCHIPPGSEVKSGVKGMKNGADCPDSIKMMWESQYSDAFIELVNQYSGTINGGIGGHTHMDEFRLIMDPAGNAVSFFHINPSISPIDGNNPGFQLFSYNAATMQMLNYTSYVFGGVATIDDAIWKTQYNFGDTYGVHAITAASMDTVWQALETDTVLQSKYSTYFSGGSALAEPKEWKPYWCCIGCAAKKSFKDCVCGDKVQ